MLSYTTPVNALTLNATAKVDAADGAYLRSSPSTTTDKNKVTLLSDNKSVEIKKEVFVKKSTSKTNRWYYVSVSGRTGYIRSDCLDSIEYSPVKGTTKDIINYRVGPSADMASKGTLKKGATVTRCLKAYLKGTSQVWYKIKKGSKYYYVSGKYVKAYAGSSDDSGSSTTKTTTVTTSDVSYPTTIWKGIPFYLHGKLMSNKTIEKVRLGVRNTENTLWTIKAEDNNVNSVNFEISTLDSKVAFGTLKKGSYIYRVDAYIDGKWKNNIVKKAFAVKVLKSGKGAEAIAEQAIALAWPDEADYKTKSAFSDGDATTAFKAAFDSVFPDHSNWGNQFTKVGADCGVFVATVIRSCGYDPGITYSLTNSSTGLFTVLANDTGKWAPLIKYTDGDSLTLSEDMYNSGDIIMYHKQSGGQHILIYVKKNGVGYMVEAGNTGSESSSYYGRMDKATTKITSLSKYTDFYVYRAIK